MLAKEMLLFIHAVFKRTPTARCKTTERCTQAVVDICNDVELNALGECGVLDSCVICNNARVCKCNNYFRSA